MLRFRKIRWAIIFCLYIIYCANTYSQGTITIPDITIPTPCVFQLPLNWADNNSAISTLIIRWNMSSTNISLLSVESTPLLGSGKKMMFSKTGSQLNLIVFGGTEPIPNGAIARIILQATDTLPNNSQIPITGITGEGADNKALPKQVTINTGKIIVKNDTDFHSADIDKDRCISLSEVLRVVQLFNAREYHCQPGTEDGYAPFEGDKNCTPHKSDYDPQDWKIRLNELLRLIQFFNFPGGSYHPDATTEDKYAPGPFEK